LPEDDLVGGLAVDGSRGSGVATVVATVSRLPVGVRAALLAVGAAAGYAVGALTALSWFDPNGLGPSFFPAAGWTLALLCLVSRRWWPVVLCGVAAAEILVDLGSGLTLAAAVGFAVANCVEPTLGATLARDDANTPPDLSRGRGMGRWLVGAALTAPLVGGGIGALTDTLVGAGRPWWVFVGRWWLGDGLGVLTVGAAVLCLAVLIRGRRQAVQAAAAAAVVAASTAAVFATGHLAVVFLPVLMLLGIALRLGVGVVAVAGAAAAFVAAQAEAQGRGFAAQLGVPAAVGHVWLQLLLSALLTIMLVLAVQVQEQQRALVAAERADAARRLAERDAAVSEAAGRRNELLHRLAGELAGAVSVPQIARAVHEHALVPLGAAGSALGICDTAQPGMITVRSTVGFPPDTTARSDRLPLDADLPGPAVLRTGRRWSCATRAEIAAQFPDALPILAGTDYAAAAVLPLGPANHVMGYLAVHYPDQRRLSGDDWALLTAIADQTAHAVRRGELAENEARQRARAERSERGQRLAGEVAARLERTPRAEQRMQELVDALVPAIADFATLELPTDAGVPRLAAVAHRDPSAVPNLRALREHHALSPNDPCSVAQVLRTGRTVALPDLSPALIDEFTLDHDALRLLSVLQPRSLLIVPLIADRRVLGVLLLGYSTSGRRYEPTDSAVVELIASRAALALRTARLYEAEHDIALTLQTSLLPAHLPSTPLVGTTARYRPGEAHLTVGGDWYDVALLPDGQLAVAIGDIVGHGITAATAMGQLRSAAGALLTAGLAPTDVLEHLDTIAARIPAARCSTACCARFDPTTAVLTYSSAGHPPPLLTTAEANVRFLDQGRSPVLTIPPASGHRPQAATPVPPGATLLLYTDGLIEQHRNDEELADLAAAAQRHASLDLDGFADAIIADRLGSAAPRDDIALLCLRFRAVSASDTPPDQIR
jgi:serine phosphatase RsbU (regulator of sigma subunit)/integral membrane sensor domain MASE1